MGCLSYYCMLGLRASGQLVVPSMMCPHFYLSYNAQARREMLVAAMDKKIGQQIARVHRKYQAKRNDISVAHASALAVKDKKIKLDHYFLYQFFNYT